jgi:curved DNA-binding protein CbpA
MTGAPRSALRWRPGRRRAPITKAAGSDGPFLALGLTARPDLTDDDVRAAWRRVAAATHPDRADGGDPQRFAAAAAAYTVLRTRFGRGEALADLQAASVSPAARRAAPPRRRAALPGRRRTALPGQQRTAPGGAAARLALRVRRGRPWRLALRVLATASAGIAVAALAGSRPATPALITGALTWLALTARHDLAPPADHDLLPPGRDHVPGPPAGN